MTLATWAPDLPFPTPTRGNPSQAVIVDDTTLLFDCGERTTVNLVRAGINPLDVDALFFTHLHWDHISDFGYFAISSWNCGRNARPLHLRPARHSRRWSRPASLASTGQMSISCAPTSVPCPSTSSTARASSRHSEQQEIDVGWTWQRIAIRVSTGAVEHHQRVGMPSVGFRIESDYGVVAITGDTAPCQSVVELARGANVLVDDAAFLDEIIEARGMWSHSGPRGAGRIAAAAGVETLVLTHLGPTRAPPRRLQWELCTTVPRAMQPVWDEIVSSAREQFTGKVSSGRTRSCSRSAENEFARAPTS